VVAEAVAYDCGRREEEEEEEKEEGRKERQKDRKTERKNKIKRESCAALVEGEHLKSCKLQCLFSSFYFSRVSSVLFCPLLSSSLLFSPSPSSTHSCYTTA